MRPGFIILSLMCITGSLLIIGAGKKHANGPITPTWILFRIPAGWPKPPTDIFAKNRLSEQGFELGRKLFYDGRLSRDGNFPCASCHQQFAAFANIEHDYSHGFNNTFTNRNAPALFNIAWMTVLHWDGSINHIEVQPLAPMTAPNEMAENIDSVLHKLRKDKDYPNMFKAAFGSNEINSQRMLKALAQFVGSIISSNSKYDKVKKGEATFTPNEQNGYDLFRAKCAGCHKEPLFTDNSFRNNGMPLNIYTNDIGRMKITGERNDSLKFKVPSLRNVGLTYPYMHDGRFTTLGQVLEHYSTGIQNNQPNLDSLLSKRHPLTSREKSNLIFFLYTLTDTSLVKDPRFASHQ